MDAARNTLRHMLVLGWQMRIEMKKSCLTGRHCASSLRTFRSALPFWCKGDAGQRLDLVVLPVLGVRINENHNLTVLFTYIQELGDNVWLTDNVYELLGKSPAQSFTVYLQPFMTPGTLLRISISWVVLLFILFSMAMAFTWGLRRFMNRHK